MLVARYCCHNMFGGCTSLVNVQAQLSAQLLGTSMEEFCYQGMFSECTSLTTAPSLPSTKLSAGCYQYMFNGCTSLTTAPALPATTLITQCYANMFQGCTSLVTAPELPAPTLAYACYDNMFASCSNLNYIECHATNISQPYCTENWVNGVASSGTFVKDASMTGWSTGTSGIPNGWTVQNA